MANSFTAASCTDSIAFDGGGRPRYVALLTSNPTYFRCTHSFPPSLWGRFVEAILFAFAI